MLTFLGGPAGDDQRAQNLMVRRAPLFLRVVRTWNWKGHSEWDALDQVGDTPTWTEEMFVYRRVSQGPCVHIRCGRRRDGSRQAGGFFQTATYQFVEPQPPEDVMRYTTRWRDWTTKAQASLSTKEGVETNERPNDPRTHQGTVREQEGNPGVQ